MRDLHSLYKVLHKNCDKKRLKTDGICQAICSLERNEHITPTERIVLFDHFDKQRPSEEQHQQFHYPCVLNCGHPSSFWWTSPDMYLKSTGKISSIYSNATVEAPLTTRTNFIKHMVSITKTL